MDFNKEYNKKLELINNSLVKYLPELDNHIKILLESMKYSVLSGGKRLRPIMLLASCELCDGNIYDALPFACSIEYIHNYSLIHDDLPAMDNDDYRRGKLTNHKVYGEGMAILAGDALLNHSFEIMINDILNSLNDYDKTKLKIKAFNEIALASGFKGIIGGQVADIISEGKKVSKETLDFIHKHKTGALFLAAIRAGAILSNASNDILEDLSTFAKNIGLAFQIVDDILDICGDEKLIGKKTKSDIINKKATYPLLWGLDNSYKKVTQLHNECIEILMNYKDKSDFFIHLSNYLLNRSY